jgi:uncharacterized protein YndB with AHSA1/START domain
MTFTCVSVTYLASTADAVWRALTNAEVSAAWWAHHNVSDWQPGSRWEHRRADGSDIADIAGIVVAADPPTRLVLTWANPIDGTPVAGVDPCSADAHRAIGPSRVTVEIAPGRGTVRLTVTHDNLIGEAERDALAAGWAAVIANLKTLLETGKPLPQPPWEMLPGFVRQ